MVIVASLATVGSFSAAMTLAVGANTVTVIATDNAALDFAIKWRAELFSNAPIVFSGLNGYTGQEHFPPRVTGVLHQVFKRAADIGIGIHTQDARGFGSEVSGGEGHWVSSRW